MKIYYGNILANHNYTARPNVAWAADITEFDLDRGKKVYIFLCIDLFSNKILSHGFKTKRFTTAEVVKKLTKVIEERLPLKPRREVILHTDRGTEFTSKRYDEFIQDQEGFIIASMSRCATPKDNPVAERFMQTFKVHKINNKTFQEELLYQVEINSKFKGYRRVFNLFAKSIDFKPNKKSGKKPPHRHDNEARTAAMLMAEPIYSKAFSEHYGEDFRRKFIDDYKIQNKDVVGVLDEIAAKRAELVDKTPFDVYDDNLLFKVVDEQLKEIYSLIRSNPDITRQYVEEAILPMQDMLESMDDKLNILLPKKRKERQVLPLRDPVYTELYEVFLAAAGSSSKYKQDLKRAQLKIAYTILFHVGLRVNEMRLFKEKNIRDAIRTSQFSVVHFKQKEPYIHVISDLAVKELKELKHYYDIVFVKYKYKYLFGKDKPVDEKYLIKMINKDLKQTCISNDIPYNVKSHSFRINVISKLLKNTSVQNTADIIGHKDVKSTMAYKRYALNKKEIQNLLNKIDRQK